MGSVRRTHPCVVSSSMICWIVPVAGLPKATYNMAARHGSISLWRGSAKHYMCSLGAAEWARPHKVVFLGPSGNLALVI